MVALLPAWVWAVLPLSVLAVATADPPPWNFGVFGIGAIVFVILSTWLFFERRERLNAQARWETSLAAKDLEIGTLQLARLQDAQEAAARERQMAERTLPLLGDTAKVLDASLTAARTQATQKDINDTVSRLESVVENMARRERDR